MFEKLSRILTGDDIFISYSRYDGTGYATNLAKKLVDLKFSVYLDRWATRAGKELPASLRRKLRRSSVLVIVGTHGAAQSNHVRQEIEEFNTTGRTMIPIIFEGVRASDLRPQDGNQTNTKSVPIWVRQIEGLAFEPEGAKNLTHKKASDSVINLITDTCKFVRKTRRQIFIGLAVLVVSAIGVIAAATYASSKRSEALTAVAEAERQQKLAAEARNTADVERMRAEEARRQAAQANKELEGKTKLAEAATQRADQQTRIASVAETRARGATIRAEQEASRGRINRAGNFFTQAQLQNDPRRAIVWASNAVEEAPREDLKRSVYSLATTHFASRVPMTLVNSPGPIQTAIFTDTKDRVAVVARNGDLTLWNLETGNQIARVLAGRVTMRVPPVFSRDGNWLAALVPDFEAMKKVTRRGEEYHHLLIWNTATAALQHDIPISWMNGWPLSISFSITAEEVLVFGGFNDDESVREGMRVWDRATGRQLNFVEPVRSGSWKTLAGGQFETRGRVPLSRNPARNWFLNVIRSRKDDVLEIRNIRDGASVKQFTSEGRIIFADFSPDAKKLISVSTQANEEVLRSWDIDSGLSKVIKTINVKFQIEVPSLTRESVTRESVEDHMPDVLDISYDGGDLLMAEPLKRSPLQIWECRDTGTRERNLESDDPFGVTSDRVTHAFFSRDGRFVVGNMGAGNFLIRSSALKVWDTETRRLISPKITLLDETINSELSPTNMILGVALMDGSVMTWNLLANQNALEKTQLFSDPDQKYDAYLLPNEKQVLALWSEDEDEPAKMMLLIFARAQHDGPKTYLSRSSAIDLN